ncbi:Vegetative incompatibility protein HET-E-1 [Psilocybe cubensis]|uniref:Nephrocystin 3-like N-terminal domain-containing protein n=2 Tax=Psilocybe cubensis TaxID=181762 RepID=A0A8H7Y8H2_PSICU|nr:Vegetative incompatibility protein HET-E-1 [Psilocybe cubensis]KAH9487249.1 Vegetative incompatibility protein HET-E-1 [Psilocybe cubensis]
MPHLPTTEDDAEEATTRSQVDPTVSRSRPSFFNRLKGAFRSRSPSREAAPAAGVLSRSRREVFQRDDQSDVGDINLGRSRASSVQSLPQISVESESPLHGNERVQSRLETRGRGKAVQNATPGISSSGTVQSSAQNAQPSLKTSSLDPAVVEAARTAALQTAIEMKGGAAPVSGITPGISGMGSSIDVGHFMSSFLSTLSKFNSAVDKIAQIHPYAQAAWTILSFASKAIVNQDIRDGSILTLLKKMDAVYTFLTAADLRDIESMKGIIEKICHQTLECSYFIREFSQNTKFRMRLLKNLLSDTDDRVQEFSNVFDDLLQQFRDKAARSTLIVVHRIWEDIAELAHDSDLQHMPYVQGAGLNLQKICLEGTREQILKDIIDWVNLNGQDDTSRIFWLHGNAGTGKSSIAHTIANYFEKLGRLGSCFCFDRNKFAEERHNKIFTVIAQDLAHTDKNIQKELAGIVHLNKALSNTSDIIQQWRELVVKPICKLSESMVGPIVIVIDALDESGNPESRKNLLRILAGKLKADNDSHVSKLPPNVRIILTSRTLSDIYNTLNDVDHVHSVAMDSISTTSTASDIAYYISEELEDIEIRGNDVSRLSSAAGELFEWARLACAYVRGDDDAGTDAKERLEHLLVRTEDAGVLLDKMYLLVLETLLPKDQPLRPMRLQRFLSVISQILGSAEPLTMDTLASMRRYFLDNGLGIVDVRTIIKPMGALLSGTTDPCAVIRPLHASFPEFLLDEKRSGEFFIDMSRIHVDLATASLSIMKEQLRFNICQLPSSYLPNSEVEDLDQRINDCISRELSYSSRFWTNHLQLAEYHVILVDAMREFFNHERLLFWIEILSLLKLVNTCAQAMWSVIKWVSGGNCFLIVQACANILQSSTNCADIADYASDVQKFVRMFGGAIAHSTPHLYLSALPFSPENSHINQAFGDRFCKMLRMDSGRSIDWPVLQETLKGHEGNINCVAFSPDGKHIVSGSNNRTLRLWDAETGEQIGAPLEGHEHWVWSVAFSPDGRHIVSGSLDKTLRLWDAQTREQIGAPLEGHQDWVWSVAFSPDGKHIVSGSRDSTLRLWNAETREQIGAPFEGHQSFVQSVAFSPNGRHIISSSDDKTLRLWDAETGKQIGAPFVGHQDSMQSVVFSPDGRCIVSGSYDQTLQMWDAKSRQQSIPFKGQHGLVQCIAFSPDGRHIVSSLHNKTLRIWDARTRKQIGIPFEGHQDWVRAVAFSPDGRRIVSGSDDKTLKLWDAKTEEQIGIPLEGNQNFLQSISFPLSGRPIISSLQNKTLKSPDAKIKEQVRIPIKGHLDNILSIAFSPNGRQIISGSQDKILRL